MNNLIRFTVFTSLMFAGVLITVYATDFEKLGGLAVILQAGFTLLALKD